VLDPAAPQSSSRVAERRPRRRIADEDGSAAVRAPVDRIRELRNDRVPAGSDRNFYFMEMNTRIQVEQPGHEEVTGYDLIKGADRRGRGRSLPWKQDECVSAGMR